MTVDTLLGYGLERMAPEAINDFLSAQSVGILGLPDQAAPYLLPLAYGYNGDDRLFFAFFVDGDSRKVTLSQRADRASFLVYRADSVFMWESVLLEGTIAELPDAARDDSQDVIPTAWRLDLFERASSRGTIRVFTLEITDRTGLRYTEVPPGFGASDERVDD